MINLYTFEHSIHIHVQCQVLYMYMYINFLAELVVNMYTFRWDYTSIEHPCTQIKVMYIHV